MSFSRFTANGDEYIIYKGHFIKEILGRTIYYKVYDFSKSQFYVTSKFSEMIDYINTIKNELI